MYPVSLTYEKAIAPKTNQLYWVFTYYKAFSTFSKNYKYLKDYKDSSDSTLENHELGSAMIPPEWNLLVTRLSVSSLIYMQSGTWKLNIWPLWWQNFICSILEIYTSKHTFNSCLNYECEDSFKKLVKVGFVLMW